MLQDAVKPRWGKGIKRSQIQGEFTLLQELSPPKYNFYCVNAALWCRGVGGYRSLPSEAQYKVWRGFLRLWAHPEEPGKGKH